MQCRACKCVAAPMWLTHQDTAIGLVADSGNALLPVARLEHSERQYLSIHMGFT